MEEKREIAEQNPRVRLDVAQTRDIRVGQQNVSHVARLNTNKDLGTQSQSPVKMTCARSTTNSQRSPGQQRRVTLEDDGFTHSANRKAQRAAAWPRIHNDGALKH